MEKEQKMTPMMAQYFSIKEKYMDSLLFYRMGDFYELFFEDAEKASQILDLTLTGRDCGDKQRAPMCGVPFHSASGYIGRLVERGFKVAICEQVEDPKSAKGIVKREDVLQKFLKKHLGKDIKVVFSNETVVNGALMLADKLRRTK